MTDSEDDSNSRSSWKKFSRVALVIGLIASIITIWTFLPSILPIITQTSTTPTMVSVPVGVPSNPALTLKVKPQDGYVPFGPNGSLEARVPNESVVFTLIFNNTGSSQLDFECCWVHIQYVPSTVHSDSTLGFGGELVLPAGGQTTTTFTYTHDLPRFPGGEAKMTFIFYSADGTWKNTLDIMVRFG